MTYLLDVNVLIALFDPQHVDHDSAHDWFEAEGSSSWATCPITENGFHRIVNSPAYPNRQQSVHHTIVQLSSVKKAHEDTWYFWPDNVSIDEQRYFKPEFMIGHKMLTDTYLIGLCVKNKGSFATFDKRASSDAIQSDRSDLITIIG